LGRGRNSRLTTAKGFPLDIAAVGPGLAPAKAALHPWNKNVNKIDVSADIT
jgi:hypothetical protein